MFHFQFFSVLVSCLFFFFFFAFSKSLHRFLHKLHFSSLDENWVDFGDVWLYNSVHIKLPRLETGSAPVPGFGMKQGTAMQQHLLIKITNCSLWKTALLLPSPGAMCRYFLGHRYRLLSGGCGTQRCCLIKRPLIQDLPLSVDLIYPVYVKGGRNCAEYLVSLSCLYWMSK